MVQALCIYYIIKAQKNAYKVTLILACRNVFLKTQRQKREIQASFKRCDGWKEFISPLSGQGFSYYSIIHYFHFYSVMISFMAGFFFNDKTILILPQNTYHKYIIDVHFVMNECMTFIIFFLRSFRQLPYGYIMF